MILTLILTLTLTMTLPRTITLTLTLILTRYYDRITRAVSAFEALGGYLGDASSIKKGYGAFFSELEDSPFLELKGAGFLLAVAFKIRTQPLTRNPNPDPTPTPTLTQP